MQSFVKSTIELDLAARNDPQIMEEDIVELEVLQDKEWDYSFPTLMLGPSYRNREVSECIIKDSNLVKAKLLEMYPQFVDVDMSNIFIAGGCISNIIIGYNIRTDIDLFIYGLEIDEIPLRIVKLVDDLRINNYTGRTIKTTTATTICISGGDDDDDTCIQIIHRAYQSPSEVIHGFDIGSCSVGILFNEGKVIMTNLGRVSLEYRINIIDTLKRGLAYETRLSKYACRNFDIVVPNLDVEKLNNNLLGFDITKISDFSLIIYRIVDNKVFCSEIISERFQSDYEDCKFPTYTVFSVTRSNISKLLKGGSLTYLKIWGNKEELIQSLRDIEILNPTEEDITTYSDNITIYRDSLNLKKLKFLLPEEYNSVAMEYISADNVDKYNELNCKCRLLIRNRLISLLEEYKRKGGYIKNWKRIDISSTINGSFFPKVISKEEFYGEYYKEV